jgi:hypothetical protein
MTIRLLTAVIAALSLGQASEAPDLILHHARIYTVDATRPTAEAIAIRGDRIARVGANTEVLALRGSVTRVIDVSGGTIVPGLQDAHGHFTGSVPACRASTCVAPPLTSRSSAWFGSEQQPRAQVNGSWVVDGIRTTGRRNNGRRTSC